MDSVPRVVKLNRTEWAAARQRAIASLDHICAICHKPIDMQAPKNTPLAVEVDHIVPRIRGGALYALENLQLTHHRCNRQKGAKMASDYPEGEIVSYFPHSAAW